MNDSKPKNNDKVVRVNNNDGVRFNENIKINTINNNDHNIIFSPEVIFHITLVLIILNVIHTFRLLILII